MLFLSRTKRCTWNNARKQTFGEIRFRSRSIPFATVLIQAHGFRQQNCFHGVDLSSLRSAAMKEYFRQPVVDTFDIRICLSKSVKHTVDFMTASEFDLHQLRIPLDFEILEAGTVHGLAFWFDVCFEGSVTPVWLSTSPTEPLTHWYQVKICGMWNN